MQEETISGSTEEQTSGQSEPVQHVFIELGGDLLAKPGALSDLLEVEGRGSTLVFCNTPSDADFVDVILKKRGIPTRKLIGHVPPGKVSDAAQALMNGEIVALVLTDVAAKGINPKDAEIIVNYSIHNDPEVYLDRCSRAKENGRQRKVISLVSPLDVANYHYVRRSLEELNFERAELPTKEQMAQVTYQNFKKKATEDGPTFDERVRQLAAAVLSDPQKEEIINLLVYNTFEVIPALQAANQRPEPMGRSDRDEGGRGDRGMDRGMDRRSNDRGGDRGMDRGDRGMDRGGDRRDRGDNRGGDRRQGRGRRDDGDRNGPPPRRQPRHDDASLGGDDSTIEARRAEQAAEGRKRSLEAQHQPVKKETRLYIGHGAKEGFNAEVFGRLLDEKAQVSPLQMKRFALRDGYSFADFPEEIARTVKDTLRDAEMPGGKKFFIQEAITINAAREESLDDDQSVEPVQSDMGDMDSEQEFQPEM